jgi:hypothetical protein
MLAEQALRLRIVLHHPAFAVENDHPVVHVLDHELVDAGLGFQAAAALARKRLVRRHALREPAGHTDCGEAAHRQEAGLHEVGRLSIVHQDPVALL